MTQYPKRLIEVDLPIKRISAHARREKSIRHGHISTLHIWWARRPLAACRAVICASLWPDPADPLCPQSFRDRAAELITAFAKQAATDNELANSCAPDTWEKWQALAKPENRLDPSKESHQNVLRNALLDFIADFANWDNSTSDAYLKTSRALTESAHIALGGEPRTRPLVVDPFAGGGAIPLEALRVGADVFASDLNPVAVLLNKVVLEYVPKYGQRLADDVRKWGASVRQDAEKELGEFYPNGADGTTPIAYFWARTIISGAPGQTGAAVEIPLLRSMWLAKKSKRKVALRWTRNTKGEILTERKIIKYADGSQQTVLRPMLEVFKPKNEGEVESGTSKGGSATCPITGFTTPVEDVRRSLATRRGGAEDARLVAVVVGAGDEMGRTYRSPEQIDEEAFIHAKHAFDRFLKEEEPPVKLPDGQINHLRGFFNIVLYGMERWGDLFSPRQALAIITFGRLVVELEQKLQKNAEMATAIQVCLAIVIDRLAEKLSSVARWDVSRENPQGTFSRQALPMIWDFCEINPFSGAGGDWDTALDWVARVLEANSVFSKYSSGEGTAEQFSATESPLPDDSVNALITDPPYYAAVPYADLSDFFYSWLKQTIGKRFPSMFLEPLSPKTKELVTLSHRAAMYREKNGTWFEARMGDACNEARRVCKPAGIGVFVFANKETKGWEAMLSALVSSGWVITASWPIDTEMASRLRARNSAALASSIHLVCRPRENSDGSLRTDEIGDWRDVLQELPRRIHEWMPRLAAEGVVGADAIFACLGPALEIFSRYARVEKASGETVALREYLEHVWAAVAKEALQMIFSEADATGFEEDARLTAMWFWTLNTNNNGSGLKEESADGGADDVTDEDDEESTASKAAKVKGYGLEYDAARKIAQGLGAHLEQLETIVEVKGDKARLLSVAERAHHLFGKQDLDATPTRKKKAPQKELFDMQKFEVEDGGTLVKLQAGRTALDRVHQAMLLFSAGRSEALKRFLVEDGIGRDQRFWSLAQALNQLYPVGTDERRWVEGVLARKKGLGF